MAVKVLINAVGQHIVAEVKQVENKETGDLVAYWLEQPRLISYVPRSEEEGGGVSVQFGTVCPLSDEQAFSVRSEHIVSILEPRDDVISSYTDIVTPAQQEAQVNIDGGSDESGTDTIEDGTKPGLTD